MDKEFNTEKNTLQRVVFDCEKTVIRHALVRTKGNITAAARLLGTTKRILAYKVHKYSIDYEQFKCELNVKEN
ncbi:MAG: helix-turn-helix domain-containing protein [Kiritimatiellae bacterium]|nr:helix-turn-helix domain-containing protein [Kiritimatiellia bacterium]